MTVTGVLERVGQLASGFAFRGLQRFLVPAGMVVRQTGTGRDQTADDDVFLQAAQVVALAHDGGLGRTRVVSWNEAAEMNESVDSEALVMPSSTLS